jgi:hypothetical protein
MKNCVKTVSSIVHNWNIIYTLFPQISGSIQCVNDVVSDINIQNSSTHDHDYCTENVMNKKSTIDKTDLITKSIFDTLIPILRKV